MPSPLWRLIPPRTARKLTFIVLILWLLIDLAHAAGVTDFAQTQVDHVLHSVPTDQHQR